MKKIKTLALCLGIGLSCATFGAWGGGFSPYDFPPIRFLNYKMVSVPHPADLDGAAPDLKKMPRYLVISSVASTYGFSRPELVSDPEFLQKHYKEVRRWPGETSFLGLNFDFKWVRTGNWIVRLLEKTGA